MRTEILVLVDRLVASPSARRSRHSPRNDLPQPYRTTRDWGELPAGVKWAAVTAIEPAPDGTHLRHPPLLRELVRRPHRGADPEVRRGRQAARALGRGDVHLPARRDRRSRRQPVGHRRARRERQGPPGLQVQSRRQGADDARQGRRQRLDARSLRSADRRRRRAERRHLRHRQPSQRQEQPRRPVHQGRQVRQGVGQEGIGPRRDQRAAHDRDGFARPAVRRRPREQPHPDLRSGRHAISTSGGSSAGRAASPSPRTTRSTSPTRSRAPTPARTSCRASRRASASAARGTARSPRSSRTWNRRRRITPAPKASASTRRATSTARVVRRQMLERHVKK